MSDETYTPLQTFLELLRRDHATGAHRPLSEYLSLFPGRELEIAEAYVYDRRSHAEGASSESLPRSVVGTGPQDVGWVAHYRVLRELGRGGQGIVFLAEDTRLNRKVALKVLTNVGLISDQVLSRFRREAEVASKLDHPGICAVYDAGTHDQVPYIAMRYVEGQGLKDRVSAAQKDAAESVIFHFDDGQPILETQRETDSKNTPTTGTIDRRALHDFIHVIEQVARALHVAHEAGVIHRDIKPQNIMVTPSGEPVVLDFGLARDLEGDQVSLTQSGDLFGTPAYMSPEQVKSDGRLDRRTDIWSLGVTLYEGLTFSRPFEAPTRDQLYQAILNQSPKDPRRLNPAISQDLKVVMSVALEKDINRRYQTALAFAEDLRRVRLYEPVHARPVGPLGRVFRWSKRNPALAAAGLGLVALLLVAAALLSYGIGAGEKADAEARLRRMETSVHEQTLREKAALDQEKEDRAFVARIAPLSQTLGFALGPAEGQLDVCPISRDYLLALRDYGLPIDGDEPIPEVAARILEHQKRNPAQGGVIISALYDISALLERAEISRAADYRRGIRPPWATAENIRDWVEAASIETILVPFWDRLVALIEATDWAPWRLELWQTQRRFAADGRKDRAVFARYFDPKYLIGRTPEEVSTIAGTITTVFWREAAALELVDRAIELQPNAFDLHYQRAGLTLSIASDLFEKGDREAALKLLESASHHAKVCIALRPNAALLYGLIGSAEAMLGDYANAIRHVDKVTELEPEMPIAWLVRAMFYSHSPAAEGRAKALTAAKRALELDPKLVLAREIIAKFE